MEPILSFLVFLAACAAAAMPGILIRPGRWYRDLAKPPWRPPDWLFGPVWLVLYVSIAIAGWLVWQNARSGGAGPETAGPALAVYALQLVLNGLWSVVFFGLKRPGLALVEILCLWLSVVATIALFLPLDPMAGYLLVPYEAWVTFAVILNWRIWQLNPARASS